MPTLLALSVGTNICVERGVVLVGRNPECDVQLDSPRVSRRDCIFTEERGDVIVRDLASTNGTWINGRRVVSGRVYPGDEVSLANIRYCLKESPLSNAGEIPDISVSCRSSPNCLHSFRRTISTRNSLDVAFHARHHDA